MRVGIVIRRFDPHRGGAERWTCQLVEHATAAGHEIHVFSATFAPETRRLPIVPHAVAAQGGPLHWATSVEAALRYVDLDVVHDMGCGTRFDVLQPHFGSWRAQFDRKLGASPRWIRALRQLASHVSPRSRQLDELALRQYADTCRRAIAVSNMVARDLERVHGWPLERTRVIYNGVDVRHFSPEACRPHRDMVRRRLRVADDELLVLFAAHNVRLKGLPTLLRAAGQLRRRQRPVRLLVAGGGRSRSWSLAARRHGLAGAVKFLGAVEDMAPFYAAADLLALPTWYDSCSLVVLEAMACALPVITTTHNGAAELLTHGKDGFVLDDPGDDAALADTIDRLLDPALRAEVGTAARQVAQQHTLAANCREVLDVWGQAVGQFRRAA